MCICMYMYMFTRMRKKISKCIGTRGAGEGGTIYYIQGWLPVGDVEWLDTEHPTNRGGDIVRGYAICHSTIKVYAQSPFQIIPPFEYNLHQTPSCT
jgi:hypothetical protein